MKKLAITVLGAIIMFNLFGCSNNKVDTVKQNQVSKSLVAEKQMGIVLGDDVFVREFPSTNGKPITTLNKNTLIETLDISSKGEKDNYILYEDVMALDLNTNKRIKLNKGLALKYLGLSKVNKFSGIFAFNINNQEMRVEIDDFGARGTPEHVMQMDAYDWINIKLPNGQVGWMYGKFIGYIVKDTDRLLALEDKLDSLGLWKAKDVIGKGSLMSFNINDGKDYKTRIDEHASQFNDKVWGMTKNGGLFGPGFHSGGISGKQEQHVIVAGEYIHYYLQDTNPLNLCKYIIALDKRIEDVYGKNCVVKTTEYGYTIRTYRLDNYTFRVAYFGHPNKPTYISLDLSLNGSSHSNDDSAMFLPVS